MNGFVQTPDPRQAMMMALQAEAVALAQQGLLPVPPPVQNDALLALQVAAHRQTEAQVAWARHLGGVR